MTYAEWVEFNEYVEYTEGWSAKTAFKYFQRTHTLGFKEWIGFVEDDNPYSCLTLKPPYSTLTDHVVYKEGPTFLPRLLVNLKLFPSTSEVRRVRPDLWVTLPEDFPLTYIMVADRKYLMWNHLIEIW